MGVLQGKQSPLGKVGVGPAMMILVLVLGLCVSDVCEVCSADACESTHPGTDTWQAGRVENTRTSLAASG